MNSKIKKLKTMRQTTSKQKLYLSYTENAYKLHLMNNYKRGHIVKVTTN